jgi:hypothetical protein
MFDMLAIVQVRDNHYFKNTRIDYLHVSSKFQLANIFIENKSKYGNKVKKISIGSDIYNSVDDFLCKNNIQR